MPDPDARGSGFFFPGFLQRAATLGAKADDAVQMVGNLKTVLGRQLVLKRFQLG